MAYITDESQWFSVSLKEPPAAEGEVSLVGITAPNEAATGESISVSVTVRNDGDNDTVFSYLTDMDTGGIAGARQELFLVGGQQSTFSWNLVMPNKILNLELSSGHIEDGEEPPPTGKLAGLAIHSSGHQNEHPASYWGDGAQWVSSKVSGSSPVIVWVMGYAWVGGVCHLTFPDPGGVSDPLIDFDSADRNESALNAFDAAGIRVWLSVETMDADVDEILDIIMAQYGHHPCIHGVSIDVEWLDGGTYTNGRQVTEDECLRWLGKVRSYNPNYKLMFWHWEREKMPPVHPEGVVFAYDPQGFSDYEQMKQYYADWGSYFSGGEVSYLVGFDPDRPVWSQLPDPAGDIANFLFGNVPNCAEVYWASWSLPDIYP